MRPFRLCLLVLAAILVTVTPAAAQRSWGEPAVPVPPAALAGATSNPAPLAPRVPGPRATTDDPGAAAADVPVGSALSSIYYGGLQGAYRSAFLANFDALTPEVELKMEVLHPTADTWNFGPADKLLALGEANGRPVRGHTLVWDQQLPDWVLEKDWTRTTARRYLRDYIRTVVGRYAGRIPEWDVVNEPLDYSGKLKATFWQRTIGDDYVADALRWAREADPDARLFVNEYGAEWRNRKQDGLEQLAEDLQAQDVPLDGIGFEAHVGSRLRPTVAQFAGSLRRFAELGLRVQVTEADVRTNDQPADATAVERDQAGADAFGVLARACGRTRACERFGVWGVADSTSWLGATERPLLLDTAFTRKPAYAAVRAGLQR